MYHLFLFTQQTMSLGMVRTSPDTECPGRLVLLFECVFGVMVEDLLLPEAWDRSDHTVSVQ